MRSTCGTTSHPGSFGLIASYWPRQIGRMRDDLPFEPLLPCVLDPNDVDQLLERLRSVHGAPRYDIAPETTRAALRLQTAGGGDLNPQPPRSSLDCRVGISVESGGSKLPELVRRPAPSR